MAKKFWKIAVYSYGRAYGGPEEGGWYFDAGDRIKEGKLIFTDPKKANRACGLFNKLFSKSWSNRETGIVCQVYFRGTPEFFPTKTPYYC